MLIKCYSIHEFFALFHIGVVLYICNKAQYDHPNGEADSEDEDPG